MLNTWLRSGKALEHLSNIMISFSLYNIIIRHYARYSCDETNCEEGIVMCTQSRQYDCEEVQCTSLTDTQVSPSRRHPDKHTNTTR